MIQTDDFHSGIFPWDLSSKGYFKVNRSLILLIYHFYSLLASFRADFKLIDCWQLKKRNEECIIQTKKEMQNYVHSVFRNIKSIQADCHTLRKSDISRPSGKLVILTPECSRLMALQKNAVRYNHLLGMNDSEKYIQLVKELDDKEFNLRRCIFLNIFQ